MPPEAAAQTQSRAEATKKPEERVEDFLSVDPMEIEIGVGLIRLADPKRGGDLLERIQRVRQNVAADIGIIMPKVRIRDNMRLDQNQYRIKIVDVPVAEGTSESQHAAGHELGQCHRQDSWRGHARAGLQHAGHLDRCRRRATRPKCSATPWSNRSACWPPI